MSQKEQLQVHQQINMQQMRLPEVKNKAPNPIQITAEQIIADPELHLMDNIKMPVQKLMGDDEVSDYKELRRKKFEEKLRR